MNINPIRPGGGRGGGGGGTGSKSVRADFNLRELPCYLSNPCETLPLLLTFIGEQKPGKFFVKDVKCCHGNQIFDAIFSQILTFSYFFSFN